MGEMMNSFLYAGYTFNNEREWKERRKQLREEANWDAHYDRIIIKTMERI
jgi:hypothetical protein